MAKLLVFIIIAFVCNAVQGNMCGDQSWVTFNNRKCFKIIDKFVQREEADELCRAEMDGTSLGTIKTLAEQDFLTKFIFEVSQIADNVWLAADRKENGEFEWADGSKLVFTNWNVEHPTNTTGYDCLQLTSKTSRFGKAADPVDGKWKDAPCNKRNMVLCQKLPYMSFDEVQKVLLGLISNPVPLGFIYTQYPNQPSAQEIWPDLVWKDVTVEYAGLFFRAQGGASGDFGSIQEGDSPRLTEAKYEYEFSLSNSDSIRITPNTWSGRLKTSVIRDGSGRGEEFMRFFVSNPSNEVRPKNTAIRVWRRIPE